MAGAYSREHPPRGNNGSISLPNRFYIHIHERWADFSRVTWNCSDCSAIPTRNPATPPATIDMVTPSTGFPSSSTFLLLSMPLLNPSTPPESAEPPKMLPRTPPTRSEPKAANAPGRFFHAYKQCALLCPFPERINRNTLDPSQIFFQEYSNPVIASQKYDIVICP